MASYWTQREIALLEEHYPVLEASEICRRFLPHRNSDEVYGMAHKLGLRKMGARERPPWEAAEVALLRHHYGSLPLVELQRHYLSRHTAEEIQQKARLLGYPVARHTPPVPWTNQEQALLHRHYASLGPTVMQREHLPHRTIKAILHQAAKLGLRHRSERQDPHQRRWSDQEMALFREHYGTMPVRELQRRYFPQRTPGALRRLATGLGLSRADYLAPWSQDEVAVLEHHFVRGGFPAALEALPHRTRTSIRDKVRRLGLICDQPAAGEGWTAEEKARLARWQHLPLPELLKHFPERSRSAVDSQRNRLRHGRR